jgi:hypothetical protein
MPPRRDTGRIRWTTAAPGDLADAVRDAVGDLSPLLGQVARNAEERLRDAYPVAVRAKVPERGGLAEEIIRGSTIRADVREYRGDLEMSIYVQHTSIKLYPINRGKIRHPVYGRRPLQIQPVPAGWWQDACDAAGRGLEDDLFVMLDTVAARVQP